MHFAPMEMLLFAIFFFVSRPLQASVDDNQTVPTALLNDTKTNASANTNFANCCMEGGVDAQLAKRWCNYGVLFKRHEKDQEMQEKGGKLSKAWPTEKLQPKLDTYLRCMGDNTDLSRQCKSNMAAAQISKPRCYPLCHLNGDINATKWLMMWTRCSPEEKSSVLNTVHQESISRQKLVPLNFPDSSTTVPDQLVPSAPAALVRMPESEEENVPSLHKAPSVDAVKDDEAFRKCCIEEAGLNEAEASQQCNYSMLAVGGRMIAMASSISDGIGEKKLFDGNITATRSYLRCMLGSGVPQECCSVDPTISKEQCVAMCNVTSSTFDNTTKITTWAQDVTNCGRDSSKSVLACFQSEAYANASSARSSTFLATAAFILFVMHALFSM